MTRVDTASPDKGRLIREGQEVGASTPGPRLHTIRTGRYVPIHGEMCHAWVDGSFKVSAGYDWVITPDDMGAGPVIAQGYGTLGGRQTAFDAEAVATEAAINWCPGSCFEHLVLHSDSTSAIARHATVGSDQARGTSTRLSAS